MYVLAVWECQCSAVKALNDFKMKTTEITFKSISPEHDIDFTISKSTTHTAKRYNLVIKTI